MRGPLAIAVCLILGVALGWARAEEVPRALGKLRLGAAAPRRAVAATLYGCAGKLSASGRKITAITFATSCPTLGASLTAALGKPGYVVGPLSAWLADDRALVLDGARLLLVPATHACLPGGGFDVFLMEFRRQVASEDPDKVARSFRFPFADKSGVLWRTRAEFEARFVERFTPHTRYEIVDEPFETRCDTAAGAWSVRFPTTDVWMRAEKAKGAWRFINAYSP